MAFSIILPITLIVGLIVTFYARHLIKVSMTDELEKRTMFALRETEAIRTELQSIDSDVQTVVSLLTMPNLTSSDMIQKLMEINPRHQAIMVAYAPEFLEELRQGKHPDYILENHFGLLSEGEIPMEYAPILYRDSENRLKIQDAKDSKYEYREWYLLAKFLKKGVWSDPFQSVVNSKNWSGYSMPFYYNGSFVGVTCITHDVASLVGATEEAEEMGNVKRRMFVLAENGRILYHNVPERWKSVSVYSAIDQSRKNEIFPILNEVVSGNTGYIKMPNWGKEFSATEKPSDTWFIYFPLKAGTDWTLVVTYREADVHSSILRMILWLCGSALLMILLLFLATSFIVFRIYNPILAMMDVSDQVADGNFNVHIPERYTKRKTVIGLHAKAFEHMTESLQKAVKQATEERQKRMGMERELEVARQIQNSLLPDDKLPQAGPDYFLDAFLVPAKFVAGDFYDFWKLNDETIAFLVADVSGKGVPAALVMVEIRTLIRQIANEHKSPGEVLTEINALVQPANKRFMFTTLVFAYYDIKTGLLRYCNAGHTAPAIMYADTSVKWFDDSENPVLGVLPGIEFTTSEFILNSKDTFFLYTDGVPDSRTDKGEPFGNERLEGMVARIAKVDVFERISNMVQILQEYSQGDQKDDITMLIIGRR